MADVLDGFDVGWFVLDGFDDFQLGRRFISIGP